MPQYPANIDLSSLNGTDGFQIISSEGNSTTRCPITSAGDINGDGFDDFIVGVYAADPLFPGRSYSGTSYVVFGKASGFPANLDLASLDGSNGFKIGGVASGDWSGRSVSSAGDVNGDGLADLIVGAPKADAHGADSGASYVVFGQASGLGATLDLGSLDGTNGFKLSGEAAGDGGFGELSVSSAGDLNGDGFDDVIVGAAYADPHGTSSGASYVVFGHAPGFAANIDLSSLNGSNGFKISGAAAGNYSGWSVSSAGDVNGDGYADLIIGARNANASYVVFGHASGFAANLDLSSLDGSNGFKLSGACFSVASAGDVNGDGHADVIVGTPDASYVVFGSASGFTASLDLSTLDGHDGFKIDGTPRNSAFGLSVASAGDVNGDGFDDVIVGASSADLNGANSGASYVVFGHASGFPAELNVISLDGSNGFRLTGANSVLGDYSGSHVASAGDINGDGLADLAISANYDAHGYIVFGKEPDTAVERVGTNASQNLVGGAFDDTLRGRGGDDNLYGHGGADKMFGGTGDDNYFVDDSHDRVFEATGEGTDTVHASVDFQLGPNAEVEKLVADADTGLTLTGNRLDNEITGGGGNDTLTGAAGNDALTGGGGINCLEARAATPSTAAVATMSSSVAPARMSCSAATGTMFLSSSACRIPASAARSAT